jgi:hypothetical protein
MESPEFTFSCRLSIIASINTAFTALTATEPAIYTIKAPAIALLQQTYGESPLSHPIKLRPKKLNTEMLTAIDRTCSGIFTSY